MAAFIDRFTAACGSKILAWLIGTNVLVFLIVWILILCGASLGVDSYTVKEWLCVPASPEKLVTRPWTVVTYMLTQFDFFHLLFNMLWLYWFGILLPWTHRSRFILWLYAGGGILGAVFFIAASALFPSTTVEGAYLCGSSASVLSVMTGVGILSGKRKINLFLIGEVKIKWVCLAFMVLTFTGLGGGNTGLQSAHFGGVIFGAIYLTSYLISMTKKAIVSFPPKEKKTVKTRRNVHRDGDAVARAAGGRLSDHSRLDILLEKIRQSGYSSLTTGERNELNEISRRLENGTFSKD